MHRHLVMQIYTDTYVKHSKSNDFKFSLIFQVDWSDHFKYTTKHKTTISTWMCCVRLLIVVSMEWLFVVRMDSADASDAQRLWGNGEFASWNT